jgi:hypothetical protein
MDTSPKETVSDAMDRAAILASCLALGVLQHAECHELCANSIDDHKDSLVIHPVLARLA